MTHMRISLLRGDVVQVQQSLVNFLLQLQSTLHGLQTIIIQLMNEQVSQYFCLYGDGSFPFTHQKPERDEWGTGLEAMQCALQLEKKVNQALLDLHNIASERGDPHLCDFLESNYLNEQVEAIKNLGDHITNLTKMDAGNNKMAEYLFDKHTLGGQS
ncbi:ferritin, middle subunit-like [Astyanax mexicanus]|uniref:Ferritin n=1 Tax=Astyanax mexicanus TaxID=7994 RepID=A0A8T2KZ74_ASTMX|nr:ferritin, middle subunit-like [Astyanax mexicanus]